MYPTAKVRGDVWVPGPTIHSKHPYFRKATSHGYGKDTVLWRDDPSVSRVSLVGFVQLNLGRTTTM